MSRHTQILAATALAAVLLLPEATAADQPTRTTIILDGSLDDWQTVLANPLNSVFDSDGSSIPCGDSSDRDCIVPSSTSDLKAFAFTWDDQNLYILVRRFLQANNKTFTVYLDRDDDGLMEVSDDLVLDHLFKASQDTIQPSKHQYNPLNGGGDPMVDALGFADGYTLPGSLGPDLGDPGDPADCTTCVADYGQAFEFAWPWSALGMAPGQAFGYHVSGGANSAEDNMAGRHGKGASTRYVAILIGGATQTSSPTQIPVFLAHTVTNAGNVSDVFDLSVTSSQGLEVCLYTDPGQDGVPDNLLGCDRKGDGDFTDGGDTLMPGADTNANSLPDTGALGLGRSFGLVLEVFPSNQARGKVEETILTATSSMDPLQSVLARNLIAVGDVTVLPPRNHLAAPGARLPLAHRVVNHLTTSETFNLKAVSQQGWIYELWTDPDGDGNPSDGALLFDSTGDTIPDVSIVSGETFPFVALASVPIDAPPGLDEVVVLSARANGNISASVTDLVGVRPEASLTPDYTLAAGTARTGSSSNPLFFRHTLAWAGDYPEAFDLLGVSSQGFPVDFYTDPNGDGSPSDGVLMTEPAQSPILDPYGGTFTFLARVSIPPGTAPGTIDTTTVYALAQTGGDPNVQATDETRVALIQVFEDAGLTESISHTPLCTTVHARARGLLPSQVARYRIVWEDPSTFAVQITPFSSDVDGEGYDQLDIAHDGPLGLWSAAIQENVAGAWVDLDRIYLEVENEGDMDLFIVDPPSFTVLDTSLTVTALFRNNGLSDMGPMQIGFRVLSPSGTLVLDTAGAFLPYTGSEDTWTTPTFYLVPDESTQSIRTILDIDWEETGFHTLEAHWENACGATIASASRSVFLDPDADMDGLDDLVELDYGLDPTDRDTDDDGLTDGLDGVGDADGDTVPDGLECDADGDGLNDGLESGVTAATADPDTDTSDPCFRPDGDGGATTTDPKDADTDDGGLNDHMEDRDADGVKDTGEADPNDPSDDTCLPGPSVEVTGLRVAKAPAGIRLSWDLHPDHCSAFRVLGSITPDQGPSYEAIADGLIPATHIHAGVTGEGTTLRSWLLQAVSPIFGDGDVGHFGL